MIELRPTEALPPQLPPAPDKPPAPPEPPSASWWPSLAMTAGIIALVGLIAIWVPTKTPTPPASNGQGKSQPAADGKKLLPPATP